MYYSTHFNSFIGKTTIVDDEEFEIGLRYSPKYIEKKSTKELLDIFPEAIPTIKKILKNRIQEDKKLLDLSLDIERECANVTYRLQGDMKSFCMEVCRTLNKKPNPQNLERDLKRSAFLLSSLSGKKKIKQGITEDDIARAKEVPLESLYTGERLYKAGNTLKGCCPFHTERTPSFYIYVQTNRWYCFGACSAGGDSIEYVIKKNGVGFLEAIKILIRQ